MKRLLLCLVFFVVSAVIYSAAVKPVANGLTNDAPARSGPTYSPWAVEALVKSQLRDPDSAQFGGMSVYGDRKLAGAAVTVVCGSVNAKNGFGGYSGQKNFIYIKDVNLVEVDQGGNNGKFVKSWNSLCAGKHT